VDTSIEFDNAIEFREHCHRLTRKKLDLVNVINAELYAHRTTGEYKKIHKQTVRERSFQAFFSVVFGSVKQHFVLFMLLEKINLML